MASFDYLLLSLVLVYMGKLTDFGGDQYAQLLILEVCTPKRLILISDKFDTKHSHTLGVIEENINLTPSG